VPPEEWSRRNLVTAPNYRDPAAQTLQAEPAAELLRRSLASGQFPFWDPYTGGGIPLFASLLPGYLFPPALLVVLLGHGSGVRNAYLLGLIAVSGILTYRLLRGRGLSWAAALTGGIAFAFSGAVIQTAPLSLGQPVALFSLPLLATIRLCEQPSRRRAAELAAAAAFVALASFPPSGAGPAPCHLYAGGRCDIGEGRRAAVAAGLPRERRWRSRSCRSPTCSSPSESHTRRLPWPRWALRVADLSAVVAFDRRRGSGLRGSPPRCPGPASLYYTGVVPLLLGLAGLLARTARPPLEDRRQHRRRSGAGRLFGWPIVHGSSTSPG
jgi:hypothetical protein